MSKVRIFMILFLCGTFFIQIQEIKGDNDDETEQWSDFYEKLWEEMINIQSNLRRRHQVKEKVWAAGDLDQECSQPVIAWREIAEKGNNAPYPPETSAMERNTLRFKWELTKDDISNDAQRRRQAKEAAKKVYVWYDTIKYIENELDSYTMADVRPGTLEKAHPFARIVWGNTRGACIDFSSSYAIPGLKNNTFEIFVLALYDLKGNISDPAEYDDNVFPAYVETSSRITMLVNADNNFSTPKIHVYRALFHCVITIAVVLSIIFANYYISTLLF